MFHQFQIYCISLFSYSKHSVLIVEIITRDFSNKQIVWNIVNRCERSKKNWRVILVYNDCSNYPDFWLSWLHSKHIRPDKCSFTIFYDISLRLNSQLQANVDIVLLIFLKDGTISYQTQFFFLFTVVGIVVMTIFASVHIHKCAFMKP